MFNIVCVCCVIINMLLLFLSFNQMLVAVNEETGRPAHLLPQRVAVNFQKQRYRHQPPECNILRRWRPPTIDLTHSTSTARSNSQIHRSIDNGAGADDDDAWPLGGKSLEPASSGESNSSDAQKTLTADRKKRRRLCEIGHRVAYAVSASDRLVLVKSPFEHILACCSSSDLRCDRCVGGCFSLLHYHQIMIMLACAR